MKRREPEEFRQCLLRRIQAALQRIEHDDHGCGEEYGERIPPACLSIDPAIGSCVSCRD